MKTNTLDFDAQALRERILDLAMRGKLVPQDPNDELASVLLEKIKAEKEELVKEKKIKKTKALPAITDDEKPFDIPDSWEWVRLDDILDVRDGTHDTPSYVKDGVPLITSKNIKNGELDFENVKYISDDDFIKINQRSRVDRDDIIFAMIGTIGNPIIIKTDKKFAIKNVGLLKHFSKDIDMNYVLYYLYVLQVLWNRNPTGAVQKFVSLRKIRKSSIPLPPFSEQKRIAAKIAQLFALLRKVESSTQQYAELQTLLKSKVLDLAMRGKLVKQDPNDEPASVLLEKIKAEKAELVKEKKIKKGKPLLPITDEEKPFDIPDSWEWVRLGDIFYLKAGKNIKRKDISINNEADLYPCYGGNGIRGYVKEYNMDGNYPLIGRQGALCGNIHLAQGKFFATEHAVVVHEFAHTNYFWSTYFLRALNLNQYSTSVAQPGLAVNKIDRVLIPLPPVSEQSRIVKKIDKLLTLLS